MGKRRIFSRVCLMVALCFVFTLCQAILPKPVRGVSIAPSGSEAASAPGPSASTETEESEAPSEEPSKAVLPSEQPIETTEKPDPAEDKKDIEPEVLEIPETIIGKYLIPIDDGA